MLAEILASNKSALCRIVSLAFGFVLRKFDSIHSRNVGSKLVWDDIAHSCYDKCRNRVSADQFHMTLSMGPRFGSLRLLTFLKSSADKFLVFNRLQSQHY